MSLGHSSPGLQNPPSVIPCHGPGPALLAPAVMNDLQFSNTMLFHISALLLLLCFLECSSVIHLISTSSIPSPCHPPGEFAHIPAPASVTIPLAFVTLCYPMLCTSSNHSTHKGWLCKVFYIDLPLPDYKTL